MDTTVQPTDDHGRDHLAGAVLDLHRYAALLATLDRLPGCTVDLTFCSVGGEASDAEIDTLAAALGLTAYTETGGDGRPRRVASTPRSGEPGHRYRKGVEVRILSFGAKDEAAEVDR